MTFTLLTSRRYQNVRKLHGTAQVIIGISRINELHEVGCSNSALLMWRKARAMVRSVLKAISIIQIRKQFLMNRGCKMIYVVMEHLPLILQDLTLLWSEIWLLSTVHQVHPTTMVTMTMKMPFKAIVMLSVGLSLVMVVMIMEFKLLWIIKNGNSRNEKRCPWVKTQRWRRWS